jgi:hypothetical protein
VKYEILTTVFYRHTFFTGPGYDGITARATASAAQYLLQHGLLCKPLRDGFMLLYDTQPAGKHRNRDVVLKENFTLEFDLLLTDHLFYNYTQVNVPDITSTVFFFSNDAQSAAGVLHRADYVSTQDLRTVDTLQEQFFIKPFGRIALQIGEQLQSSYQIRFSARASRWCYFLMSEGLQALSRPGVISTNGNGYFGVPQRVTLPDRGEVPVFISQIPVPFGNANKTVFQLVDYSTAGDDKYKVIISALPAPETGRISNAAAAFYESGFEYAEIFLY